MDRHFCHGLLGALSLAFDLDGLYGDGANLYQYLGSNPWTRSDPLGLSYDDPFDMVDEFLAADTGSRAAFLNQIGMDARAVAVVAATIASYVPFPIVSQAGELALLALGQQGLGQYAVNASIGFIPGGKLAKLFANTGLGKLVTRIGASAWQTAVRYASRFGAPAIKATGQVTLDLGERAAQVVARQLSGRFARHHLLPVKFGPKFHKAGIDIEDYVVKLDADYHKALHAGRRPNGRFSGGSWNEAWRSFWEAYPEHTIRHGHPSSRLLKNPSVTPKNRVFDSATGGRKCLVSSFSTAC